MPTTRTHIRLTFSMINGDTITSDWEIAGADFDPEDMPEILADLLTSDVINNISINAQPAAINTDHILMIRFETEEIR